MAGLYKRESAARRDLNNVDLLLDQSQHNPHLAFDAVIARAREGRGHFSGVNGIARIDSAASRLLQLDDLVASVRKWVAPAGPMRAGNVHARFGVQIVWEEVPPEGRPCARSGIGDRPTRAFSLRVITALPKHAAGTVANGSIPEMRYATCLPAIQ